LCWRLSSVQYGKVGTLFFFLTCTYESSEDFVFDSVATAVAALKRGELLVVMDDETRENEGDLLMAAEFATPEKVCIKCAIVEGNSDLTPLGCLYDKAHKWDFVCTHDGSSCQIFGASANDN
jgi:hypothetical protein